MTFTEGLLLASICFVAMVSPGPDFLLVTRNAIIHPRSQALATAFGIIAGCATHALYCVLGLALIITKSVLLFSVVKYAGACYLIYLGLKALTSKGAHQNNAGLVSPARTITNREAFMQGYLCNLLNPKLAMFLLSLFTQFLSATASVSDKVNVALIFFVGSLVYWPLLTLALQAGLVKNLFLKSQTIVDRTCGALLICLGVRVAFSRE